MIISRTIPANGGKMPMKTIASFTVNHDKLKKGMYVSRIDGDVITYDVRTIVPNNPENVYMSNGAMHTFEHLFATFARNSVHGDEVVYVGPMGCRTGFYFLTRDTVSKPDAIALVRNAFAFIRDYEGEIPGTQKWQCGNYKEHDLAGAKAIAADMTDVLADWTEEKLAYEPDKTFGVLCAMDSELRLLLDELEDREETNVGGLVFYSGRVGGSRMIAVKCGIGKVNAARSTQLLIDHFAPDYILNSGIAGGVAEGMKIGDVVFGTELVQYDFDVTVFGHVLGYLCTGEDDSVPTIFYSDPMLVAEGRRAAEALNVPRVRTGRIATGDVFLSAEAIEHQYLRELKADAAEMESAAIAQVAAANGTPFLIIRTMSDLGDETSGVDFDRFEQETADLSARLTLTLIRNLSDGVC